RTGAKEEPKGKEGAKEKPKVDLTPLKKKAQEAKAALDRCTRDRRSGVPMGSGDSDALSTIRPALCRCKSGRRSSLRRHSA
ncbi:MAG: hypothetical protein ACYSU0_05500, partial [Planctomycetota bacterium]